MPNTNRLMSQNTNTPHQEPATQPTLPLPPTLVQIRDALLRLREAGGKLPPVDAAAIIRESRHMTHDV